MRVSDRGPAVGGRPFRVVVALAWMLVAVAASTRSPHALLVLPLGVACLFIMVLPATLNVGDSPGFMLLGLTAAIRYLLLPTFMLLTDGDQGYALVTDRAVILMTYEALFVLGSMLWVLRRKYQQVQPSVGITTPDRDYLAGGIVGVAAVAILLQPAVLSSYHTLFTPVTALVTAAGAGGATILVVSWGHKLLPVLLSNMAIRRFAGSARNIGYTVTVVAFLLITVAVFTGLSRQSALVPGVAGLFYILKLFPSQRRRTWAIMTVGLAVSLVVMSSTKTAFLAASGGDRSRTAVDTVELYFNGYSALETSLVTRDQYLRSYSASTMLTDILGNVPGLSMDLSNRTTTFFNYVVYGGGPAQDQIIPFTGQALFHWGFLLCWIPTVGVVLIVGAMDRLYRRAGTSLEAYIYAISSVVFGMAFMLNITILCAYLFTTIIPGLALIWATTLSAGRARPVLSSTRLTTGSAHASSGTRGVPVRGRTPDE